MDTITPINTVEADMSAIDFEVTRQPVYGQRRGAFPYTFQEPKFEEIPDKFEWFRADTGTSLGIHSGAYHHDGYTRHATQVANAIQELGFQDKLDATDAPMNFEVFEDGRKMKLDVLFPRHVIEPAIGDITKMRLRDFDSYDGSWGRKVTLDGLRLWCLNGCTSPDFKLNFYAKHTKNIGNDETIQRMIDSIERGVEAFSSNEERFRRWVHTPVSIEEAEELFSKTIAFAPQAQKVNDEYFNHSVKTMERLDQLLSENFRQCGRNLWGTYNAATEWATHVGEVKGNAQIHNVERTRESKVASMLKSKHWKKIESIAA